MSEILDHSWCVSDPEITVCPFANLGVWAADVAGTDFDTNVEKIVSVETSSCGSGARVRTAGAEEVGKILVANSREVFVASK